ncbi:hypothetical protein DET49_10376 [Salegentibacter sp. 24]|uniref:hypothetical protein n=1 Tax=Salegentibacter sp. 24 TaxID=2183986 RepID=UPI001060A0F7|nr:hypothetical protein [Salegentibacter sp. 24]TDN95010.1 hypothetical protein DET49_10376 [Salegentibacter sp. 24]
MNTGKILISSIIGTSAMTIFSYLVSNSKNKNFREPEVLGKLIKALPLNISKDTAHLAGWGMHYTIGFAFVASYNEIWKQTKVKPSLTSGILMGTASGVLGTLGWKLMFKVHPNPPAKNLKPFFGHLLLAHIVFGIFSALSYRSTYANRNQLQ